MRLAIISFTVQGGRTAERLERGFKDLGHQSRAFSVQKLKIPLSKFVETAFRDEEGLVFVGAAGIAVRSIAPCLKGKDRDPAVIVVDELGNFTVSLLSGHLGGANELALAAASILGAQPVITTATDINHAFAVDLFAKKNELAIDDLKEAKEISAAVLRGEPVGFFSDFPVEGRIPEPLTEGVWRRKNIHVTCRSSDSNSAGFPGRGTSRLRLIPRAAVLGMGCRRGVSTAAVEEAARQMLSGSGFDERAVRMLASIELKRDEAALIELAAARGLLWNVFSAEELQKVDGSFAESEFVRGVTGVGNVCERAALAGAGMRGKKAVLAAGRRVFPSVTAAIAVEEITIRF